MKKLFLITILFSFLIIFLPITSLAYVEESEGSDLIATVSPENPKAGEIVTISLRSFGFSLTGKVINWKVNGKPTVSALGATSYSFQLGKPGTTVTVEINLVGDNYIPKKKTLYFQSSDLDLIWQTDSYVPPFYQGKALPSPGSTIKVLAIPVMVDRLGKKIPIGSIFFDWKKDGRSYSESSGLGRNFFVFKTSPGDSSAVIGVEASVNKEKLIAAAGTNIVLKQPTLLLYENKALDGTAYQKTITGEYDLYNSEVTIKAEPYFLNWTNPSSVFYKWLVNGDTISNNPQDPSLTTFRQQAGTEGVGNISVSVGNKDAGQQITNNFIIKFGKSLININGQ